MARIVATIDFMHSRDDLPVQRCGASDIRIACADHQAHRLAVAAGNVLPAAFEAVVAAARDDGPRLDQVRPRRCDVLDEPVRVGDAAAREHRLDVVLRHAVARDQYPAARFANAPDGHRGNAQRQVEAVAGDFLRLGKRGARVFEQARWNAQHAAVALEAEGNVGLARRVQHGRDGGRADGVDVLVLAALHRDRGIRHVAQGDVPVIGERRVALGAHDGAELGHDRQIGVEPLAHGLQVGRLTPDG